MRRRDLLSRIDLHLERGNELMQLNVEALNLNREELKRNRATHEDLRRFIEEITIRNERVYREVLGELTDLRRETQAQTKAIFRILDRLPPWPPNSGPEPEAA